MIIKTITYAQYTQKNRPLLLLTNLLTFLRGNVVLWWCGTSEILLKEAPPQRKAFKIFSYVRLPANDGGVGDLSKIKRRGKLMEVLCNGRIMKSKTEEHKSKRY